MDNFRLKILLVISFILTIMIVPAAPAEQGGMNILLITLDTTRADHIGCYNAGLQFTPNIDDLGKNGVIYENCYSNIPVTLPSHASMLTGKHPYIVNVRNNGWYTLGDVHETIPEILKKQGYHTFAVISSYVLASKFGLSQGFDTYDDSLDVGEMNVTQSSQIPADMVLNKFRIHLKKAENKKFFGWVHFYDPHTPYSPPGEFGEKFDRDPYLGEIAYVDHHVGKLVRLLRDGGVLNNTVIIVAGDHGEDKGEHLEFSHGIFCYDVTLKVPLIIWNAPGFPKGKRVDTLVKLTDIFETVKKLAGVREVKGDAPFLLKTAGGKETDERDLYFESLYAKEHMGWSPLTGIISKGFKYISLPEPELYDLKNDPGETNNIAGRNRVIAEKLDTKLRHFYSKAAGISTSPKRELSKTDREQLASLGYISSFKTSKKTVDPKIGMAYLNKLREIRTEVTEGKLSSAERKLKKLYFSPDRIDTIHVYEIFDALYKKKGDLKNLLKFRELAHKDFPEGEEFANLLAVSYFAERRFDESEKICAKMLETNPKSTQAIILLGKIYLNRKDMETSLSKFREAEEIEPMNFGIKRNIALVLHRMGRGPEAIGILDKISGDNAFRRNADNIKLLTDISLQYLNSGAGGKGFSLVRELLSLHPENPSVYAAYGNLLAKTKKHSEALRYFKSSLSKDPGYAPAHNGSGISNLMMFMEKRDPAFLNGAVTGFSTAISLDPQLAESFSGRGTAYIFLNNMEGAISDLENALKLDPGLLDVYFNLGIVYLRAGRKSEANAVFRKCRENFYTVMKPEEQKRLDNLIRESR